MVTVRTRGTLPHWESPQGTYFVTFRLADLLPRPVAAAFEFEQRNLLQTARAMHRELSGPERQRLATLFSEKYESYLDAGSGSCVLRNPKLANLVTGALRHFHGERYHLFAWCVMPNHVHVVFQPLGDCVLAQIVHTWKFYSAHAIARVLKKSGTLWQREYYDHWIRSDTDLYRCVHYVLQNPAKAGLQEWRWVGIAFGAEQGAGETPALLGTK